jgi:Flp pilus assembly protein TadG
MQQNMKLFVIASLSKTFLVSFLRDRRGVAAMEFALIAPVMILLFLGGVEVTDGFDVNKKLGRAGTMVGDLITQQQSITKEKIADIMEIGAATLLPYRRDLPKITVTSIEVDDKGSATVAWSQRKEGQAISTPYTKGSKIAVDSNLLIPKTNFIRVETGITYIPLMAWTMKDTVTTSIGTSGKGVTMGKTAYGRVRQGEKAIACSNC